MTVPSTELEWVGALNKALNEQNTRLVAENERLRAALDAIDAHIQENGSMASLSFIGRTASGDSGEQA